VGRKLLFEDECLIVVKNGLMHVVKPLVGLVGAVLHGMNCTEMAASIWCSTLSAPCRSLLRKASSRTLSLSCWMFFNAAFNSAFTSGGEKTGRRLKVRLPSEEAASLGLEIDYLGRREEFIQY